jgi:hypothetical protein
MEPGILRRGSRSSMYYHHSSCTTTNFVSRAAVEVAKLTVRPDSLRAVAATRHFRHRGDILNKPTITIDLSSPSKDVVEFSASHFLVSQSLGL